MFSHAFVETAVLSTISPPTQAVVRFGCGALLLLQLGFTLPLNRWYFRSERWGGYAQSMPVVDAVQNPWLHPAVMALWMYSALMLCLGSNTVLFAGLNLALCWYHFIFMRWRGVLRGMGAPGFMSYWLGACVFFLELARYGDPSQRLLGVALLAFQVDYAVIMLCAGTYKALAGYPKNEGMQLGMVNPWWGYWWWLYKGLPYHHPLFRLLNHLAYSTEIVAALLMLNPSTRAWGALLIILSFIFITTQIRLTMLCEVVMVAALIFMPPGLIDRWVPGWMLGTTQHFAMPNWLTAGLTRFFWVYVALLPLAKLGQYYNFLARRSLPAPLQYTLERWTNAFGIIIWRVFSVDVVNFFVRIYERDSTTGREVEYTRFGRRWRYCHVGEFICLASLFTTLKYYPSNNQLFTDRLMRYARTIPCGPGNVLRFAYMSVVPHAHSFDFIHVSDFVIDPRAGTLEEQVYDDRSNIRAAHAASPVHEGARPGSYAPPP